MARAYACRLCHHDQADHNLREGCPHCRCMATPGEANPRTDADLDRTVAPPHVYAQPWMDPTTETGRQRRLAPLDAEATGDLLNSLLGTDPNHTAFARALNEAGYVVVPREAAGA